ncbi:TetR family transcriptional regulator [Amycolatopsis sp. NPDC049253]
MRHRAAAPGAGLRAATVGAIAQRSGLPRAGLLHHFANKQAVLTGPAG